MRFDVPIITQMQSPLLQGISAAQRLRAQNLAQQMQREKLKEAPQLAAARLAQLQALANLSRQRAQMAPAMQQARLGQTQAATDLIRARIKALPKSQQIALMNAVSRQQMVQQSRLRFNKAYAFGKALQSLAPGARAAFIAKHPQEYANYLNSQLQQLGQSAQHPQQPVSGDTSPVRQPAAQPPGVAPEAPPGLAPDAEAIQLASQIKSNEAAAGKQITNRFNSALVLEGVLNDPRIVKVMNNASMYAGIAGKGKAAFDALKQSNPKEYEDYLEFRNYLNTNVANMIKQMEGLSASNQQREELKGLLDKTLKGLTTNPARALDQMHRLKSELANITKQLSLTAQPMFPSAKEKAYIKHHSSYRPLFGEGETAQGPEDRARDILRQRGML